MNPLLDFSGLPRFADIQPEHVASALAQLLEDARNTVARSVDAPEPPTWENFVAPLEDVTEKLSRAWGQVAHLNAVMNSPALREAYNANLPIITQYFAELGQHAGLFRKYRALHDGPAFAALTPVQQKIVRDELRDFRLGGAELPEDQKKRFLALQEDMARNGARFEENLLDATNAYGHFVDDPAQLAGMPADVCEQARASAEADGKPGWKFTLHMPAYLPVMQYAEYRPLRETLYRAYVTRASEFGPENLDNTLLIRRILELRREAAQMLGFANFAELSLATKMAETPAQVIEFLEKLAQRARPYAERDLRELREFAARELGLTDIQAWDMAYVSEKLRAARYSFSDQEVKQYFTEAQVISGMFKLVETLYGLQINAAQAPVWHPDARFYRISDANGDEVGAFYLDLYARPSKRGGAWMDDAITRRRKANGVQTPVAYLTCNFSSPVGTRPALFTHDEVITLFHEFGHGLHHLLTRVDHLAVSGINGVEWDAVELPSQFMENFCWEWGVLRHMARHVETSAALPRDLYDKMVAAKNFQSGMQTLRQIEFSLFDMQLHGSYDPAGTQTPLQLLDTVRSRVAVVVPPAFNRFPNNFSHIFAGGYAAGYYSYKWAEVLSADAYALFEENGVLDPATGARFREEILGVGGSRPALESFTAFRGREPTLDALLRHNGMAEAA
jgi:oligopeptidase A